MNETMHPKMTYLYIGIDTHKETHTATFINFLNEKLSTITFTNDLVGYNYLIKETNKLKGNLTPVFGLEDTKLYGYGLASFLFNNKYWVKYINATYTYNERCKNPIVTKTDEVDSSCIAKVLLDEFENLPDTTNDELYWTLKQLVTLRARIIKDNVALKYRLHAQLLFHYPKYKHMFSHHDGKQALKFWETYPSPDKLENVTIEELAKLNSKESNNKGSLGRTKAAKILKLIKENEIINSEFQEERNIVLISIVQKIQANNKLLAELEESILKVYRKTGKLLHTIPLISELYAAMLLSEIGNVDRFESSAKLAKYAGIAPIEKSSGKTTQARYNRYGNRTLNSYIYVISWLGLSTGSRKDVAHNPIFKEYYEKRVNSGKTKHQAIICIMRRMVNIMYRILKYDIPYEEPTELLEECKKSFTERIEKQKLEEEQKLLKKKALTSKKKVNAE